MLVIRELASYHSPSGEIAFTVGNFDGVHLGHRAILSRLKKVQGQAVVLSFENHPADVLRPQQKVLRICTLNHKIKLLEELGIDVLILLAFTKEFSEQSAEEFIRNIRGYCPFTHLILGHDATMGKDRHGDRPRLQALAKTIPFHLKYIDEQTVDGIKISSSHIRKLIQQGALGEVEKLLGRKYSILTKVQTGQGLGKRLGFPTINVDVEGLCLPPFGVYAVEFIIEEKHCAGVANLGIAPTVRQDNKPILEVHLLTPQEPIESGTKVEVQFRSYLRPEQKFADLEALKAQIAQDIQATHRLFTPQAQ